MRSSHHGVFSTLCVYINKHVTP